MHITRQKIIDLYKNLIRESRKFTNYNFRMYALRRTRDAFRENKHIQDSNKIQELYKEGLENLAIIKRQVIIGQLFKSNPLVIENLESSTKL